METQQPVTFGDPFADEEAVEEWVEQRVGGDVAAVPDRWKIETLAHATWAMSKYAAAAAHVAEVRALADDARRRIAEWEQAQRQRADASLAFFGWHLEQYALGERDATMDRVKSVTLIDGQVKTRATAERVVVVDDAAVIAWAKAADLPDVVRVKEEVAVTALRGAVQIVSRLAGWIVGTVGGQSLVWLLADGEPHVGETIDGDPPDTIDYVQPHYEQAAVDENGEVVPGVQIEPRRVTASVEVYR